MMPHLFCGGQWQRPIAKSHEAISLQTGLLVYFILHISCRVLVHITVHRHLLLPAKHLPTPVLEHRVKLPSGKHVSCIGTLPRPVFVCVLTLCPNQSALLQPVIGDTPARKLLKIAPEGVIQLQSTLPPARTAADGPSPPWYRCATAATGSACCNMQLATGNSMCYVVPATWC